MSRPAATGEPARPRRVLPVIVAAQFASTSLWFAVNAVMPELQRAFAAPPEAVGTLTSAVQLGFIAGTLVFGLLALTDRIAARHVFLACALLGAAFNALAVWLARDLAQLIALRALSVGLPWTVVFEGVAFASIAAGLLVHLLIPEPPHPALRSGGLRLGALWVAATEPRVRASVLGYFGHMWELYTMWVLVPAILATRLAGAKLSWWAFGVLGAGAIGCAAGGAIARRIGSAPVAGAQLAISGLCCLAAPLFLQAPTPLLLAWLFVWGVTVSGDSPQFSALTAGNSPPALVGSVLTLANSIGFAISIASIELFVAAVARWPLGEVLPWLALGPALGVIALRPLLRRAAESAA